MGNLYESSELLLDEASVRAQTQQLIQQRDQIQSEMIALQKTLEEMGVGAHSRLVDNEGFPRNDIDVVFARQSRNRLSCLATDFKLLTENIEKHLHMLHSFKRDIPSPSVLSSTSQPHVPIPFATIDSIETDSPAMQAGLALHDKIVDFDKINAQTPNILRSLGEIVRGKENVTITVRVLRGSRLLSFDVIPRRWSGDGLLGCHIVAM